MADTEFNVDQHFPYDGPHSDQTVTQAARAIRELTRYIANATGSGNGKSTLAWAATVRKTLATLGEAADNLDQVLEQIAGAMTAQAKNPTLYHEDDLHDHALAARTAAETAAAIHSARGPLADSAALLQQAGQTAYPLGNN